MEPTVKKTIDGLVAKLEELSEAYYTGNEQVDDATFDALEDKLRNIDPSNPYFTKNREKAYSGDKVAHPYEFIGSLDKIHAVSESKVLPAANQSRESVVWLSAKLDGTSMVVYFENGKLYKAVTRGDGKKGVDVTRHYLAITKKYNVTIPENFTGAIRGEVVFQKDNWLKFKELHPEAKAPRNSGTGLVNQKEVMPEDELLDYVIYDIVATNHYSGFFDLLYRFNVPVVPSIKAIVSNIDDSTMKIYYDQWSEIYPCDGVVIRQVVNCDFTDNIRLYTFPKNQEAYKFQAQLVECIVNRIEWQLGRTGKLTPVLKIDPVVMDGAVVSSITAHNAENVKKLGLGKEAKILAYRSGLVIPAIHSVLESSFEVIIPRNCPYCGSRLEYTETGKDIICTYEDCEGKSKFRIFNFIEQMCKDIKGIGDVFLENFVAELNAQNIPDLLLAAAAHKGKPLNSLGNSDNKIAAAVIDELTQLTWDAEKFWLGLGIRHLGAEAAKKLSSNELATMQLLHTLDELIDESTQITEEDAEGAVLVVLPGQRILAKNIVAEAMLITETLRVSDVQLIFAETSSQRFYAITGSLSKPRKALEEEFSTSGWQLTDNISKAEVLITDNPSSGSSKNEKAKKLGKPVITEEQFRNNYLI